MRLLSFRLFNHKSYIDTLEVDISGQMNVIVGQNNVGKTALLHILAQRFDSSPHRDSKLPVGGAAPTTAFVEFSFSLSGEIFKNIIIDSGVQRRMPAPSAWERYPEHHAANFFAQEDIILASRFSLDPSEFGWKSNPDATGGLHHSKFDSHVAMNPDPRLRSFAQIVHQPGYLDTVSELAANSLGRKIYFFDSHRIVQSASPFGTGLELKPDASNLAEVLGAFQSNTSAYRRYIELVRRVIPTVKWVSVKPSQRFNGSFEIMIWNIEESTEREDLANPLSECGTGVGQVLAILYVLAKSAGDIIIIDEPNSFLHPGAAKTLVEILRESKQHQFIISTHAPEVIAAARPERLFVLRFEDEQTMISRLNERDIDDARLVLNELGSRLSDVFGYDRVVWVEGSTEVQSLPIIMNLVDASTSNRITFAQLRNTGDLKGKHGRAIAEIYKNLSAAHSIIPEPLAVLLDGDQKGSQRLDALEEAFPGIIKFLPRYTFENYLFHPKGIAAVLNSLPGFDEKPTDPSAVSNWIAANGSKDQYIKADYAIMSAEWIDQVNGTALFHDLFQELSDAKEIHRKPQHTVMLVRWLSKEDPSFLHPLLDVLRGILPG